MCTNMQNWPKNAKSTHTSFQELKSQPKQIAQLNKLRTDGMSNNCIFLHLLVSRNLIVLNSKNSISLFVITNAYSAKCQNSCKKSTPKNKWNMEIYIN